MKGAASEAPEGAAVQGWFARLDEFGQKHARLILTVSAGLIILIVLIVANVAYRKSLAERVSRDIAMAESVDMLKDLRQKYAGTSELSYVLVKLGHRLYEAGELEKAEEAYKEFLEKFPDHLLAGSVKEKLKHLQGNLKFVNEQRDALALLSTLENHPLKDAKLQDGLADLRDEAERLAKDPAKKDEAAALQREIRRREASPLAVAPVKRRPELVLSVKTKEGALHTLRFELFEDEAPNTVASLVQLADAKHFAGMKLGLVNDGERAQTEARPLDYALPFEPTSREGDVGSLVMTRAGAHTKAGEFQILIKSVQDLKDVTVCGILKDAPSREILKKLGTEDIIESVTVENRGTREYRATTVKP